MRQIHLRKWKLVCGSLRASARSTTALMPSWDLEVDHCAEAIVMFVLVQCEFSLDSWSR